MGSTLQHRNNRKSTKNVARGNLTSALSASNRRWHQVAGKPELKMSLLSLSCPHLTFLVIFILSIFSAPPDDGGCD